MTLASFPNTGLGWSFVVSGVFAKATLTHKTRIHVLNTFRFIGNQYVYSSRIRKTQSSGQSLLWLCRLIDIKFIEEFLGLLQARKLIETLPRKDGMNFDTDRVDISGIPLV